MLLKALEDADPFTRQAARRGMARSLKSWRLRSLLRGSTPAVRLGALLVLRDLGRVDNQAVAAGLANDNPSVRFVAIRWVGEEGLSRFRGALRDGLASGSVTRPCSRRTSPRLERLDGKGRDARDEQPRARGTWPRLVGVENRRTPPAVLRRALRVLRPDHPALDLDRLDAFLGSRPTPGSGSEPSAACERPEPARFERLAKLAADPSAQLRSAAGR